MHARRKRALGAVSAVAALALAGGVAAQFSASTQSAPQQIGTGTMALSLDNVAPTVWTDPIANLAAGDSVQRFVDLRNSGSLKMSGITLSQTNTLGSLLSDPSDVRLTLESCSVAWNTTTGACAGTQMVVLGQNSVRGWGANTKSLSTFDTFGAGEVRHLRFTTQVAEGATNAVQGKSGEITYTFSGAQRAAGYWGSTSDAYVPLKAPTNVTVTPSGDSLVASWTDTNSSAVPYTVGYSANGGAVTKVDLPKGQNSYTLTNPTPGVSYDFAVSATAGAEAATVPAPSISILQAPALTVTQTGTAALKATITDNSAGKASYKLTYTPAGGTATTVALPAGTLSYDLTGLQLATAYTVTTTATLGTQTKTTSATSTLPVSQAGSVALTSTDTTMGVSWVDTNAGQASYSVSYVPASGGTAVTVVAGATSANITGLSASTSYIVTLAATKNDQTKTVSVTKSTTAPVGVDFATASWTSVAPYTTPLHNDQASGVAGKDGNVYVSGAGSAGLEMIKYDVANNSWSTLAPLPAATVRATSQVTADGSIYVIGGATTAGTTTAVVQKYVPSTNTWTQVLGMRTAVSAATSQVAADGSIYVFGGINGNNAVSNVTQKYVPSTNTWTTVAPMPTAAKYATSQVAADGSIYVFGGYGGGTLSAVQRYVPSTNTWTVMTPMPTASNAPASQVSADGSIYVFGGQNSSGALMNAVQRYVPSTNTWTTATPMPWTRYFSISVKDAQGRLYLVGGYKNGVWTNQVDRLG